MNPRPHYLSKTLRPNHATIDIQLIALSEITCTITPHAHSMQPIDTVHAHWDAPVPIVVEPKRKTTICAVLSESKNQVSTKLW